MKDPEVLEDTDRKEHERLGQWLCSALGLGTHRQDYSERDLLDGVRGLQLQGLARAMGRNSIGAAPVSPICGEVAVEALARSDRKDWTNSRGLVQSAGGQPAGGWPRCPRRIGA